MKTGFLLLAALGVSVALGAAAPKPPAAVVSRSVLELPPGPGNPRNSEGTFLALRDGRILFIYSRFIGNASSDSAKAQLAARVSADAGDTWSGDTVIATPGEDDAMNVMSVSLVRLGNGDIGLFYLLRRSWHDLRMFVRRSTDEGRTWSAPVVCMPEAGYYVVNNDRVIRLSTGRLVIPAAHHVSLDPTRNVSAAVEWRGVARFFLSDDDGRTWRVAPGSCQLPVVHTRSGLQEPGVVELPDGQLWGWARTDLGRQYEMTSADGGEHWTAALPSRFTSPNSPLSIKRIPGANRLLAVWNPAPGYETRVLVSPGGDRTPLVLATGTGPATGWMPARLLDGAEDPTAGFCYTAMHFTADSVLLAYCAGGTADHSRLSRLRIRKVMLTELR
jgi:sialidase-1